MLAFLSPIFLIGQSINDLTITSSINCYGDFECVDIEFQNLDNNSSYDLWVWRDIGDGTFGQLASIFEDFTNDPNFSSVANIGTFDYCFELNGDYNVVLYDDSFNELDNLNHTTSTWPAITNIQQLSSNEILICNGDTDGSLKVAGTGGVPPLSFSWIGPNGYSSSSNDGSVISEITNLAGGEYNLILTDGNGCQNNSFSATISEPSIIDPNVSQSVIESCFNSGDAQIISNPNGGNGAPYTYLWSNAVTTESNIVGAGTYSVVVKDNIDCESPSESITINPIPELVVTNEQITDPVCVENLGQVTISASGGTGTIQYQWPNGTSTNNVQALPADSYSIVVNDQNNCTTLSSFTINFADSIDVSLFNINDVSCFEAEDGDVNLQVLGGSPIYNMTLSGLSSPTTNYSLLNSNIFQISNLAPDFYELSVVDNNNCTNNNYLTQFFINEPNEIVVSDSTLTNVSCFSGSDGFLDITISGGSGSYTYSWVDESNSFLGNSNSLNNLEAGTYTLSVNDGSCQELFSFEITEPTFISFVSATANNVSCFNEDDGFISNTQVQGGVSPYTFSWESSNGQLFNTANPDSLSPSNYSLTVTDDNNCLSLLLTTVNIVEPGVLGFASLTTSTPSCNNVDDGIVDVLASGGTFPYSYSLQEINSGNNFSGNLINDLAAGDYVLNVTDDSGCSLSTNFTFINPPALDFSANVVDVSCFGYNDGYIVYDYSNDNPPYTIELNGQFVVDSVFNLGAGLFSSTLSDGNGCQQILVSTISEPDPILVNTTSQSPSCNEIDINQNALISNGSLTFNISGASGAYTIIGDNDTNQTLLGIPYTVNNLSAGQYDYQIVDDLGCATNLTTTVEEQPQIQVFSSITDVVINGSNTGSIDITIVGGNGPYQSDWLGPNFSSSNQDVSNLFSGIYSLTVTDNKGCVDLYDYAVNEDTCDVSINPNIQVAQCNGDNALVNFNVSGGIAPYNCFMQGDIDGDGVIDDILPNISINSSLNSSLTLPSGTQYTLEISDFANCFQTYNFVLEEPEPIVIAPELVSPSCFGLNDGKIIVDPLTDISGGSGNYTIQYQGLNLLDVNPFSLSAGQYVVIVTDSSNCQQIEYYTIDQPDEITLADTLITYPNCAPGTNTFGSDGQIVLVAQGGNTNGTGIYLYNWSDPSLPSIQQVEDLNPGIYGVTISDQTNCSSQPISINLEAPQLISYSNYSTQEISCFDNCDGAFNVNTLNAQTEVFSWFNENNDQLIGNTNVISFLCEGAYRFTVENDQQCFVSSQTLGIGNLVLENPEEFSFNLVNTSSVPNGICNGIASITTVIGEGPFTYNWSNGDSSPTIDSLCGGTIYNIEVVDVNSCSSFEQFVINEDSCNFSIGDVDVAQPTCTGVNDAQIFSTNTFVGGFPPFKVSLFDGSILLQEYFTNTNFINFSSLPEGNYNVFVEDAGGCFDTFNALIESPEPYSFSYTLDNVDCFNSFAPQVHMTITGGTPYNNVIPYDISFFGYEFFAAFEENGLEQFVSGNPLQSGTYPLVVTDANGCSTPASNFQIFGVTVPEIDTILVTVLTNSPSCPNIEDGSANLSFSGGVGPFQINWYEVGNIFPINGLDLNVLSINNFSAGDYYVSIVDALGCESIEYFTINAIPDFEVNTIITPPSCIGSSDAIINAVVSGSNGGFNYLWSPSSVISNNITNLSQGNYDLIITDQNGCVFTESVAIVDPDPISIEFVVTPIICNGFSDGALTADADGGVGSFNYSWFIDGGQISSLDGGISPTIQNLISATYSVIATDSNFCTSTAEFVLGEPTALNLVLDSSSPSCFGLSDGIISSEVSGGFGNYSYSLLNSSNVEVTNQSLSNTLVADNYTFIVSDDSGCQLSESVLLTDPNEILLTVNENDVICYGASSGSASFSVENTVGNINSVWSSVISLANITPISFSAVLEDVAIGNYQLEVIDSLGCIQTQTFSIDQPQQIELSTLVIPSNCSNVNGASAQVSSIGAASPVNYLWTINQENNISQIGNTATGLAEGLIYVNGVDANGCVLPQETVEITASTNPLIQGVIFELNQNICFDDNVASLYVDPFYLNNDPINGVISYQWSLNGVEIPSQQGGAINSLSNIGPGIYSVELTDQNLGCINSTSIELINPDEVVINIENLIQVDCFGDNTGSATVNVTNGSAPFNYSLNNAAGFSTNNNLNNLNDLSAGQYDLVISDANNCIASSQFDITENDSISINFSQEVVSCFNESDGNIFTNVIGGFGQYSFVWTNENAEIESITPSLENVNSQNYYLTVEDELNCSLTDSLFLDQAPELVVLASIIDVNCFGDSTGSISLNVSGGTGDYSYSWNLFPDNTSQLINLSAGDYSVTVLDENGCQFNSTYTINESSEILVTSEGVFENCSQGVANITSVSGGVSPYDFYWDADPTNTTNSITGLSLGTHHTFYVYDSFNCFFVDSVLIDGTNEIITNASVAQDVACYSDSNGSISVTIVNDDLYPYSYSLNNPFNFENTVITQSFVVEDLIAGSYVVYIKDAEDCIDSTSIVIISEPELLELSTSSADVLCNGNSDGIISISAIGGISPYTISLDGGNTTLLTSNGTESLSVSSGLYDIIVSDENDCVVSSQELIEEPELLEIEITELSDYNAYNLSCFNSTNGFVNLLGAGGFGSYQISVNNNDTLDFDSEITISNLSAGDYSFKITDQNFCTITIDTVLIAPLEMVYGLTSVSDFNGLNTSCFGVNDGFLLSAVSGGAGPYDYSSNGGLSFEISNTVNEYQFNDLGAGLSVFQVKDINECIAEFSFEMIGSDELLPSLSSISVIECYGDSTAVLNASVEGGLSSYNYFLSYNDSVFEIASPEVSVLFENLQAGFYELNVSDINGCSNAFNNSSQFIVAQPESITCDVSITEILCNSDQNASVEITNISGGIGNCNLKFYDSFGYYFEQDDLGSFDYLVFDSLYSSSYTTLIVDENDCSAMSIIEISEPDSLQVELVPSQTNCFGDSSGSILVNVIGGNPLYTISSNGQDYFTNDSILIDGLTANQYSISIQDINGCAKNVSAIVSQPDSIINTYSLVNNVCYAQSQGEVIFTVSGGNMPYQYQLLNTDGLLVSQSDSIYDLAANNYSFIITDSTNCIATAEITISEPQEILIDHVIGDESCINLNDGSISTYVYDYQNSFETFWSSNLLSGLENNNVAPGLYVITVVDNIGCFVTDSLTVKSASNLEFISTITAPECNYISNGQLDIDFVNEGAYSVLLESAEIGLQANGTNGVSFNDLFASDYNLTIVYNQNCVFDTLITIESNDGYSCIVTEPTFSPNFDGVNDSFIPMLNFDQNVELSIFNQWGVRVFYEESSFPSWDGKGLNGSILPTADYYYIIKFNNQFYKDITGIITLLK